MIMAKPFSEADYEKLRDFDVFLYDGVEIDDYSDVGYLNLDAQKLMQYITPVIS